MSAMRAASRSIVLSNKQISFLEQLAKARLDSKLFSKADLRKQYLQIAQDEPRLRRIAYHILFVPIGTLQKRVTRSSSSANVALTILRAVV